ncbi:putative inactive peptidyl-prolyl cis-trans isomerase-like 6 [Phlyctochytrium bullatum]|nr:putative inactive peptidyl-prolyl cis-trans isomerase-like 6 [Phlyctochytrium bullatum]
MPPLVFQPPKVEFVPEKIKSSAAAAADTFPRLVLTQQFTIRVFGILKSPGYQRAKHIAEVCWAAERPKDIDRRKQALVQNTADVFRVELFPYFDFDYAQKRAALKKSFPNLVDALFPDVFILVAATPKPPVKPQTLPSALPDIFAHRAKQAAVPPVDLDVNLSHQYEPKALPAEDAIKASSLLTTDRMVTWLRDDFSVRVAELKVDGEDGYAERGVAEFVDVIAASKHKFIYIDVAIDKQPVGRIIAEIFSDIVPATSAHFMSFVSGTAKHPQNEKERLGYSKTNVSRLVKDGWLQAGEFEAIDGLLEGDFVGDENFIIEHRHRGQLSMVNRGPHSAYSQFMISFKPMPYFDRKFVSIGRCVDGADVLDAIEAVEARFERPVKDVEFVEVGEWKF